MKQLGAWVFLCASLSLATSYASDCVLGKLDSNGNAVPVAKLGAVVPDDENSLGSASLNATITAACVGLGAKNPGVLCGFVEGKMWRETLKARRSLPANQLLATGHATSDFGEMAVTWLNPGDNQTHLIACFN